MVRLCTSPPCTQLPHMHAHSLCVSVSLFVCCSSRQCSHIASQCVCVCAGLCSVLCDLAAPQQQPQCGACAWERVRWANVSAAFRTQRGSGGHRTIAGVAFMTLVMTVPKVWRNARTSPRVRALIGTPKNAWFFPLVGRVDASPHCTTHASYSSRRASFVYINAHAIRRNVRQ